MKTLTVVYDVTGMPRREIDALLLEAVVQAEESRPDAHDTGHRECYVVRSILGEETASQVSR